jgi:hypothetical protein
MGPERPVSSHLILISIMRVRATQWLGISSNFDASGTRRSGKAGHVRISARPSFASDVSQTHHTIQTGQACNTCQAARTSRSLKR